MINFNVKNLLLAGLFLPAMAFAQQKSFTLTGTLTSTNKTETVYLRYRKDGKINEDSAIVLNGTFKITGTLSNPVKALLTVDHHSLTDKLNPNRTPDFINFYLEGSSINVKAKDSVQNAVISGSATNDESNRFKETIGGQERITADVTQKLSHAASEQLKDTVYVTALQQKRSEANRSKLAAQYSYIKANPDHFFSLLLLMDAAGYRIDAGVISPIYQSLNTWIKNTPTGKEFGNTIDLALATSVGAIAPDFTQNDVDGHPVKLSDFRGKYVLLDFWASWCGPCRAENPNVVKAYHKYKDDNFTVLSVSLDQPGKRAAWLAAIKADGLDWTHVSDLQFWNNAVAKSYGIKSIPQNYLLDPTGKIIAKDLRGKALILKLQELMNH